MSLAHRLCALSLALLLPTGLSAEALDTGTALFGQPGLPPAKAGRLSLNFQNIEVRAALQVIAEFTGLNLVASDAVGGTITLRLKNVPWEQALQVILSSKHLEARRDGNVVRIAPREEWQARDKQQLESAQQLANLAPLQAESFVLNYKSVEEVQRVLDGARHEGGRRQGILSERGSLLADPKSNTLIVHDTPLAIAKVRLLLAALDKPVRQVLIEARIVEAGDNFQRDLGVKLAFARRGGDTAVNNTLASAALTGNGSSTNPIPFGPAVNLPAGLHNAASIATVFHGVSTIIGLELSALQAEDKGRIISSPRVLTADRTEASIEEGTEIPYQEATSSGATSVSFKKAVLSLKVKPQITPNRHILLDLQVNKDTPNHKLIVGGTPAVDTKRIQTQIQVENDDTIVIGGIYVEEQSEVANKVPWLGDLPVLGPLFGNSSRRQQRRELLIFITPHIVEQGLEPS